MMAKKPKPSLSTLLLDALKEALENSAELLAAGRQPFRHYEYPTVQILESGFPSFGKSLYANAPSDYSSLLPGGGGLASVIYQHQLPPQQFPKFESLATFCESIERLRSFFADPYSDGDKFSKYHLQRLLAECVNRYRHSTGNFTWNVSEALQVLEPIYQGIRRKSLNVTILVPIALMKFDFERARVAEKTYIMRMPKNLQLARTQVKFYGSGAHKHVVGAASHALVLTGWNLGGNEKHHDTSRRLGSLDTFPSVPIDTFFAALRLVTGNSSGYAQLLYCPRGWALNYFANLPTLYGTTVRKYPNSFDNFGWSRKSKPVSKESAVEAGELFHAISQRSEPQLTIAVKRLNACHLRDDPEDTVIDATIGLEALLSDGNAQEMTHKLALRAAALLKLHDVKPFTPGQLFREVKKVYGQRSAIVHGGRRTKKGKKAVESKQQTKAAAENAVKHLSFTIKTLVHHPRYFDPFKIDSELLLDSRGDNA